MKKLIQACTILTLVVAFTVVSVSAKSVMRFDADIPFDFSIGQKSFPAGTYVIKVTKISSDTGYLSLENSKGDRLENVLVTTSGDAAKAAPTFIFHRYENQRFLAKIMMPESGLVLPLSKNEKQLVKKTRRGNSKTQIALAIIH